MSLGRRAGRAGLGLVVFLALAAPAAAEPNNNNSSKLRAAVSADGIRQHEFVLQLVGDVANGNRLAGTSGYDASALYVAARAAAAGHAVSFQDFEYDLDFLADWKAPILRVTSGSNRRSLVPGIAGSVLGGDFGSMFNSPSGDLRDRQIFAADLVLPPAPVANTSTSGCEASDFEGMEQGAIALLQRGTCGIVLKWQNAEAAGADGIVWINEGQPVDDRCCPQWFDVEGAVTVPIVAAQVSAVEDLSNGVLAGPTGERGRLRVDWRPGTYPTKNVIAETRWGDPDKVIVIGAHLDSVGVGPGINDNGSGSSGILEIAEQLRKVKPRNKIRFVWFSAEESGLLGSEAYVASLPPEERARVAAMLNFDMIGSSNFVRFVYDGDLSDSEPPPGGAPAGSDEIEDLFLDYFAGRGLAVEPTAFDGRSDYGPFIAAGIPAGGLFTGAEETKTPEEVSIYGGVAGEQYDPCYHLGCDRLTNLSSTVLEQMADAAAHATITLAQSRDLPGVAAASEARSLSGGTSARLADDASAVGSERPTQVTQESR